MPTVPAGANEGEEERPRRRSRLGLSSAAPQDPSDAGDDS